MTDTRSSILETRLRLFGKKGIEAVRSREIAAAAGRGVATLSCRSGGSKGRDAGAASGDGLDHRAGLAGMGRRRFRLCEPVGWPVTDFRLRETGHRWRALDRILPLDLAQPQVLRRMARAEISDPEAQAIAKTLGASVEPRVAAGRRGGRDAYGGEGR